MSDIISNVVNHVPGKTNIDGEIEPMDDLLYIEPELKEDYYTEAGIFIAKPKKQGVPTIGKVLLVGKNIKTIAKGDKVVFKDPNARGFWANNVAHVPLKEEQIIAVIKGDS